MLIILSILDIPLTSLHFPGFSFDLFIFCAIVLYKISFINVDFPDPETPVIQVNTPNGNLTSIFFRLCSVAPFTSIYFPFVGFLRFLGTSILFLPLKYCPVMEFSTFFISSAVPCSHNISTMNSSTWSYINYLICCIHRILIMFYYN